jgi:uncharacterized circularly permuted ATP-grasp superfamily protein
VPTAWETLHWRMQLAMAWQMIKRCNAYVPELIKYYLNEEQILPNVPTYQMVDEEARNYVFDNIENMVIKRTNQSGGYGMVMGNKITEAEWLNA